jgi:hypothetical protein
MKWAKKIKEVKDPNSDDVKKSYGLYDEITFDKQTKNFIVYGTPVKGVRPKVDFEEWVSYPFPNTFTIAGEYEVFKDRYQMFCGGWLQFYDLEIGNGKIDHHLLFDWSDKSDPSAEYMVKIFISPPPKMKPYNVYVHIVPPAASAATDPPPPPPPPPPPFG